MRKKFNYKITKHKCNINIMMEGIASRYYISYYKFFAYANMWYRLKSDVVKIK